MGEVTGRVSLSDDPEQRADDMDRGKRGETGLIKDTSRPGLVHATESDSPG